MSFDKAVANLHGNHYGKAAAVGDRELLFFWHRSNFELDGKAIFFFLYHVETIDTPIFKTSNNEKIREKKSIPL
jgi:hypothetical protein